VTRQEPYRHFPIRLYKLLLYEAQLKLTQRTWTALTYWEYQQCSEFGVMYHALIKMFWSFDLMYYLHLQGSSFSSSACRNNTLSGQIWAWPTHFLPRLFSTYLKDCTRPVKSAEWQRRLTSTLCNNTKMPSSFEKQPLIKPGTMFYFCGASTRFRVMACPFGVWRSHSDTPHWVGSSGRVISPTQRPLPDTTQHSQKTDICSRDWIRTRNPSKRSLARSRLRPRGQRDRRRHVRGIFIL
jgi:hypothetical protein